MSGEPEMPEMPEVETQNYVCMLKDGTKITIEGVSRAEKDGSGRRFYGASGEVIAAFDDGQSTAHWIASAPIIVPPPVEPEE